MFQFILRILITFVFRIRRFDAGLHGVPAHLLVEADHILAETIRLLERRGANEARERSQTSLGS